MLQPALGAVSEEGKSVVPQYALLLVLGELLRSDD